jgi:hypothetical protein
LFVQVYDASALMKLAIYAGHVTVDEHERSIVLAQQMAKDAQRRPQTTARIVVIVESNEQPAAGVRRRLAEADNQIPRYDFAFVSRSLMARAANTAIGWLSPARAGCRRGVFETFEQARAWLVAAGAPESQLAAMYAQARSQQAIEPSDPNPQR